MATVEEIKNLPDGAHLKATLASFSAGGLVTYFGIYHRKETEANPKPTIGRYNPFERVFAYWEVGALEKAYTKREKFKSCACYSGSVCPDGGHLTYIKTIDVEILPEVAGTSSPSGPDDECVCPMLFGGYIDHTVDCKYILSKQA